MASTVAAGLDLSNNACFIKAVPIEHNTVKCNIPETNQLAAKSVLTFVSTNSTPSNLNTPWKHLRKRY